MTVCEFCHHFKKEECDLGLTIPKRMSCREFGPAIERFCRDPKDFVNAGQIMQMARFFGFQRTEMKKTMLMAIEEEGRRSRQASEHLTRQR